MSACYSLFAITATHQKLEAGLASQTAAPRISDERPMRPSGLEELHFASRWGFWSR